MRPTDPRLVRRLAPARRQLGFVISGGVVTSLLVIGQAWLVAGVVVAVAHGGRVLPWALAVAGVFVARGLVGLVSELAAARAAGVVGTDVRRELVRAVLSPAYAGSPRAGETAVLVTRGVSAAEPYLTRYLPALVLAGVLPVLTVVAMATQDVTSAVIVLATLPLIPVFGALVGLATRDRAERQWRAMASLSGHFLDVMRGLPTLVAFRRAEAQTSRIREVTERYRKASLATFRIAFASSAVLELVATLSVALVAVTVGVRLAGGGLDLRTALIVLLLAPEAYWPLRRVGAEFHAAAEGVATFERVDELLSQTSPERLDRPRPHRRPRGRRRHRHLPRPGGPGPRPGVPGRATHRHHRGHGCVGQRQVHPALGARRAAYAGRRSPPGRWSARRWARPGVRRSRCSRNDRSSWPAASPTTYAWVHRARATPTSGWFCDGWLSRNAFASCPRASTPSSARTARLCPPASAPASRWRASCSATVRGSCSTSRPPTSTPSPSTSSATPSSSSPVTVRCSSSPTARPSSGWPTTWSTSPRPPHLSSRRRHRSEPQRRPGSPR